MINLPTYSQQAYNQNRRADREQDFFMDSNHLLFKIMPTLTMFVNAGIMGPIGFIFGFAI